MRPAGVPRRAISPSPCRRPNDPAAYRRRDRARRQGVDEEAGRKNPALRMAPADERLGADDRFVRQSHLRLVVDSNSLASMGAPELHTEAVRACACARITGTKKRHTRPPSASPGRARDPHWRSARRRSPVRSARSPSRHCPDMQDLVVDLISSASRCSASFDQASRISNGSPQPGMTTMNRRRPAGDLAARAGDFGNP